MINILNWTIEWAAKASISDMRWYDPPTRHKSQYKIASVCANVILYLLRRMWPIIKWPGKRISAWEEKWNKETNRQTDGPSGKDRSTWHRQANKQGRDENIHVPVESLLSLRALCYSTINYFFVKRYCTVRRINK